MPAYQITLARLVARLMPGLTLGGLDTAQVTSDPAWVERIKADPLHWQGGNKAKHGNVILQALKALEPRYSEVIRTHIIEKASTIILLGEVALSPASR